MEIPTALPALPATPAHPVGASVADKKARLEKAAQEFESLFLQQMMSAMRKTVQKEDRFSGGQAEAAFQPMLDQQYAMSAASRNGGIGIGRMLYQSLERAVERTAAVDLRG